MADIECKLGVIEGADGSAELRRGSSRAVAILQGPTAIGHEHSGVYRHLGFINFQATHFHFDDPRPGATLLNDLIEQCVQRDAYPRTEFTIHVNTESSNRGLVDSLAFNAATLCLLDAAVRMHFHFAAVSVALVSTTSTTVVAAAEEDDEMELVVEPPNERLSGARATFVFVFRKTLTEICLIGTASHGRFTAVQCDEALRLARSHALFVFDYIREQIRRKLQSIAL